MSELLRTIEIELTTAEVHAALLERLKKADISGFRRDHLPLEHLRRKIGDEGFEAVLQERIRARIEAYVKGKQEEIASRIWVDGLWNQREDSPRYRYRVQYEVFPRFTVTGLEDLTFPKMAPIVVGDAEVEAFIEIMRRDRSPWRPVDRPSALGDRVLINYHGTVDDKPFPGSSGNAFKVELGAGGMLPEFEVALTGIESGRDVVFAVDFPPDYGTVNLCGKRGNFTANVLGVQELDIIPMDDEFAKLCGEQSLDALRAGMRAHLVKQHEDQNSVEIAEALLEQLAHKNQIALPVYLLRQNLEAMLAGRALRQRRPVDQMEIDEDAIAAARRDTHRGIVVRQLVADHSMTADEERVAAKVLAVASSPEAAEKLRGNDEFMRQARAEVLQTQVIEWLSERARHNDYLNDLPF